VSLSGLGADSTAFNITKFKELWQYVGVCSVDA